MAEGQTTSTAVGRSKQKPFGEKMTGFMKQFPDMCDVTFFVGPQESKIKSSRVALMASSPAIHAMFKDTWDTAVTIQGEGIPLPGFEPNAFEAFLKLLMADDWSPAGIKEMNLSTDTVFKMIEIAKEFKVLDLQQSLQESMAEFFENFPTFVKSQEFLKLPRETLETVLSSNLIALGEVSVFNAASEWAKWQCSKKGQTQNGENWRHALGLALFQIRFPLMTLNEFSNVVGTTRILSEMEEYKMLKFLSLNEQNRLTFDASNFPFKTQVRQRGSTSSTSVKTLPTFGARDIPIKAEIMQSSVISPVDVKTLKFFDDSQIDDSPHFKCKGNTNWMDLQVDKRIAIESVGFLGPVKHDSVYEAEVEIVKTNSDFSETSVQKVKKTLKAKRKEKFEVAFDQPVVLEATYIRNEFWCANSPYYVINYSLKGSNTQTVPANDSEMEFRREVGDIGFYCRSPCDPIPLQFLKFKRV